VRAKSLLTKTSRDKEKSQQRGIESNLRIPEEFERVVVVNFHSDWWG